MISVPTKTISMRAETVLMRAKIASMRAKMVSVPTNLPSLSARCHRSRYSETCALRPTVETQVCEYADPWHRTAAPDYRRHRVRAMTFEPGGPRC
jgi:hypothetical protein